MNADIYDSLYQELGNKKTRLNKKKLMDITQKYIKDYGYYSPDTGWQYNSKARRAYEKSRDEYNKKMGK